VIPVLLAMPGNERMADALAAGMGAERGHFEIRHFPDGESYVRIESEVVGREVVIVCSLDRPDEKLVPLLLLSGAARENGATGVGLVAPYLAYMRQDRRFKPGEVTSVKLVAKWIGAQFDWLVTVDPHLHRIKNLAEVYAIPSCVVPAAGAIAEWIRDNVRQPLLVGPDEESLQWVADVAGRINVPHVVLTKTRRGDRDVSVSVRQVERWRGHTPVLVDDIVSTARTMIETVRGVLECGLANPVCIAVHAVFAPGALEELREAGAAQVVSSDAVEHLTNAISLAEPLTGAVSGILGARRVTPLAGARHYEKEVDIPAAAGALFDHVDDHARLAGHMEESSALMMGGRMTYQFDAAQGRAPGSVIRVAGRVLGLELSVEEVVTVREVPRRKTWQTRGATRLLVIGAYRMGFEIDAVGRDASKLRVFIDYTPAAGLMGRIAGILLTPLYARWCVRRMAEDARRRFVDQRRQA